MLHSARNVRKVFGKWCISCLWGSHKHESKARSESRKKLCIYSYVRLFIHSQSFSLLVYSKLLLWNWSRKKMGSKKDRLFTCRWHTQRIHQRLLGVHRNRDFSILGCLVACITAPYWAWRDHISYMYLYN